MSDGAGPILDVAEIETCYGLSQVLFGLSLTIAPGEMVTLMGRNGMGKTTTVRSIMGLTPARAGSVKFLGAEIRGLPSYKIAQLGIGLVPEGRQIFPNLSVRENLLATAVARDGGWTLERVHDLFPRLAERASSMGNQLSGGEQQMLAIGRALVGNPKILLLDEPFEGLAPVLVDSLMAALQRLRHESRIAMILVEQHVELALEVTRRAVVLDKGQVVWEGDSAALAADRERLAVLIGLN
jgi:branched-chain amino acid transport system ATP-binding protein